jgi:diguanylate cyclase (GGDEF)-like protein
MGDAEPTTAPGPQRRPRLPGSARVWLLAAFLALGAAVTFVVGVVPLPRPPGDLSLRWWMLLPLFAGAEIYVVHLQFRRDAHSFSLSEIPLVLGLASALPTAFVASRLVGAGAALVLHRRQRGMKLAFNLSTFALETSLAVVVYRLVLDDALPSQPRGWAAAFAAMLLCDLLGAVAITLAMALYEGSLDRRMVNEVVVAGAVAMGTNTSLGLVAVIVLDSDVRAAGLLVVLAAILFLAYRAYASLTQGYARLELLYGFTNAVGRSVQPEAVLRTVLLQARDLLRADTAEIRLTGAGWDPFRVGLGSNGEIESTTEASGLSSPWWTPALKGEAVLVSRGDRHEAGRQVAAAGHKDAMAVPLRGEDGVIGVVTVTDRLGDVSSFDAEDLKLFETLANHASVSLENGRLVDRLRDEAVEKEHQALHDALTALPNRRLFGRCVDEALTRSWSTDHSVAVLLMDLDHFKEINDTLGHHTGDQLLCEVGSRLKEVVGERGTIARLGGDEFAVLLGEVPDDANARAVAGEVLHGLEQPFTVGDLSLVVGASIGIAVAPAHGRDTATLLQRADVAMYSAKAAHVGIDAYAPERDQYSPRRLRLATDLRSALEEGGLDVHYQPQAELATGRVTGVECLLRWAHPELGAIGPDEFVPVAEHTGLIRPLTHYVLDVALEHCAAWRRSGLDVPVAVNLSVRSLLDPELAEDVARLLRAAEVPARALTLEITETSIMGDPGRTLSVLDRLAGLGLTLAIDDFGTGYSSLAYLKRLPVDEVKIDKSFVLDMKGDPDDEAIVRSTVDLGHNLGLRVVAEGVEDGGTWRRLAELGCDRAQGFHLARPMPAEALERWLAERRAGGPGRVAVEPEVLGAPTSLLAEDPVPLR